jgi:hypothetical protein
MLATSFDQRSPHNRMEVTLALSAWPTHRHSSDEEFRIGAVLA